MHCRVSVEQLWSWIDRKAPELEQHLADCPQCRTRAEEIRTHIGLLSSDLAALTLTLPESIGRYRVKRLLGEGGQALVYEAEQPSPQRPVALKVLKGGRFAGKTHLRQFRRETQTLAALNHPGIATIYEAGVTEEGHHYFAMELVPGRPLDEYGRERGRTLGERLALFRRICEAVDDAHRHGVIHRDLKPSNIMVTPRGDPKVLDFGLARILDPGLDSGTRVTETGAVQGTPRYMSPEQASGSPKVDARSDVYSLGVILYELLTGEPPYETGSGFTPETLEVIRRTPPRRPSDIDRSLRGDLDTIVLRALAKDPAGRYRSVAEMLGDLERHERGEPILARPVRFPAAVWKRLARRPILSGATMAGLVLVLFGGWWIQRPSYDRGSAQRTTLRVRCELFAPDPSVYTLAEAIDLPRRYPGFLEATLTGAHGLSLERKESAIDLLEAEIEKNPSRWELRALLDEMEGKGRSRADRERSPWPSGRVPDPRAGNWYGATFTTLDPDLALVWSRRAVSLDPGHLLALESVTRLSEASGDLENALEGAAALEARDPNLERWLSYRSTLFARLGRYREALAEVDRLLAIRPTYNTYKRRAALHRHLGRYEEAVRDYTNAMELRPDLRGVLSWLSYHRGTPLWILGRKEEAAADLRTVYENLTYPTFANARLYLILRDLGRPEEARRALDEARCDTVEDPWVAEVLAALAGEVSPSDLVDAAGSDSTRICEATYYAGEICLLDGRDTEARTWFERCAALREVPNPGDDFNPMSEQELARWRLGRDPETGGGSAALR